MKFSIAFLAALGACTAPLAAAGDPDDTPTRELGTVTVTATRPTSLPNQIPTTIEGITGDEVVETINATDSEDALKYFPSLLVRKRYIGDYDHAVLATRASGTGNSARSLVYADGILISNLLGNGATFTPRWGLVTPEEIERVDVLYGPFSAAYPGNSVGAVVDYVTRMPDELEMHVKLSSFGQDFAIYDSQRPLHRLAGQRFRGRSQRQFLLVAQLQSSRQRWAAALVRQQAREHRDRRKRGHARDRRIGRSQSAQPGLADPGFDHAVRDRAGPCQGETRATTFHRRCARATRWAYGTTTRCAIRESYLRDAAGNPVYSGPINVAGRSYNVTPADFAPGRSDLTHLMHGLSHQDARPRALGLGARRERLRLCRRHRARTDRRIARRAIGRRRPHHRSGRHRLARARRCAAPGAPGGEDAHVDRFRRSAR